MSQSKPLSHARSLASPGPLRPRRNLAPVHDFPAGRLAAWATAWLTGRTSYDDTLDAVTGDTAHRVSGLPGTDGAVPLGEALKRAARPRRAAAAPGAPRAR